MDNKDKSTRIKQPQNNDATIIRPPSTEASLAQRKAAAEAQIAALKIAKKEPISPQNKPDDFQDREYNPSTKKIENDVVELTRINKALSSEETSRGFEKARSDANQALNHNKIILNKRFVLESTLGSGGMGTVYKAQDLRKVEANDQSPYVAVKVLNSSFQDHPDAFVSLQREASRSHTLSHPNIITVHDFDRDGNVFFMTMELLEGQGLEVILRNVKNVGLPKDEALSIIHDYGIAVEHAHQKNIIHSDLKPGNIFISKSGAKVLDFGIARFTAEAQLKNDFDAGTLCAMTPTYASLEMIQYKPPTPSDDVFAAAIIAYELFSGTHPYDRKPADQALAENLKPKRLSCLSKRQWKALSSALQLEGNKRTASMQQFLDGLLLKKKIPIFKITSLIFLIALSWFGYTKYFVPDELTTKLNQNFDKAKACYEKKNYSCTIENTKAVIKMEPNNNEAITLLQTSEEAFLNVRIEKLLSDAISCIKARNDLNCANLNLQQLIDIAEDSEQTVHLRQLIEKKDLELYIADKIQITTDCMDNKDYLCVLKNTSDIIYKQEHHSLAKKLRKKAKIELEKQKKNISENNRIFNSLIKKAQRCFTQNNYECASKYSKQALNIKPSNIKAETLHQKSNYAMIRQAENIKRANNILDQGQQCFKRKNYSCSIAKSESALEFVPGYKKAIRLKNKAKNEINKLKKSIIIN